MDPEKTFVTSGSRLGRPAGTTRGVGEAEFAKIGALILRVLVVLAERGPEGDPAVGAEALEEVHELCRAFPIYAD